MSFSLNTIADFIDATIEGDAKYEVDALNTLEKATNQDIAFAVNDKYIDSISKSNAGAIIVSKSHSKYCKSNILIVDNVYLAYSILSHKFKIPQDINNLKSGSNYYYEESSISSNCIIGSNVLIGKNTSIGANSVIEDNVCIGSNSLIESNVTIQKGCQIGNSCVISPGAVIGSEGFGNARTSDKKWSAIAHLGNVSIGNNVSIGANTTIDRGSISDTEIHDGVKLDNLIHIAHNVVIGEDTAIAAKTGIAGTTMIGKRCMIGGAVGIVDHLKIADDVVINATSTVNRDITKPGVYTGFIPLMPHSEWKKVAIWLTKLDKIATFIKIKLKNIR